MSAAAAAIAKLDLSTIPPATDLEDLLYDILAGDGDPSLPASTLEAVKTFVHEHARSKKSQSEFAAFFTQHGLAMQPERPALLALPPLDGRGRASETPTLRPAPTLPDPPLGSAVAERGRRALAWLLAAAACAGLATASYLQFSQLQAELAAARTQAAGNAAELARMRADAQRLRADLRASTRLLQRVEHKSDLLLQTLASPLAPEVR